MSNIEGNPMKKFTKILAFAATAALAGVLVAGCASEPAKDAGTDATDNGQKTEQTAPEGDTPAQANKLIVGYDNSYPPYGFIGDDGNPTGLDLDLAAAVCEKLGWEFEADAINWDAKDALIGSGEINCIWNGFTMEGRENDYTFSEPYMLNEQVIVVKKGSGIDDLGGLVGKTVVTQVDSAALDVLEGDQADLAATFSALDQVSDYNTAFMSLESGQVDAVACDLSIAAYQIAAKPDAYVQLPTALSSEHYAVGFKKGDTEMAQQVTQALKELYADGTVQKLCEKYADYGVTVDNWVLFE